MTTATTPAAPSTDASSTAPAAAATTPTAAPSTLLGADPAATNASTPTNQQQPATTVTGAPDKYADFTMPEGVTADATAIANFAPVLKGLNLTQDQAQQLVTTYANEQNRIALDFSKQLEKPEFAVQQAGVMLNGHREAWAAAVKADKDIGGANFDANVQTAQRALARFGTPELKDLLNTTGLGNHPALMRLFVAVGKQIREDVPNYGASGGNRKATADVFWGGDNAAGAN